MTQDDLTKYLNNLQRDECYQTDAILKQGEHETTQRVSLIGANGVRQGSYIRKYITVESGLGTVYELLFGAWQAGERFKHIPVIHDCYRIETDLVVVMEDVSGETLQDVIIRHGSSFALVYDLFPRICDAAIELHNSFSSPVIHRDLKPSNIMISQNSLTLIDFGIARVHKEEGENDTNHFGTRSYAPPEQFGFGQTDVRSDVYSLGMLLYYCLAERTPTAKIREKNFVDPAIPEPMREVIVRATNLDPEGRYKDVAELKAAFLSASQKMAQSDPYVRSVVQGLQTGEGTTDSAMRKGSILSKIPRGLGLAWNIIVMLVFLFFVVVGCLMTIDPSPDAAGIPLYGRAIMNLSVIFFILGPVFFLVLDKRMFARRFPAISEMSFLKQIAVALIVFAIGFIVIGVSGSIWK